jgi:hypothetical protein
VQELRRVNRQFSVQVTDPHPLSESSDPVLSLYKWWPGGRRTFNIPQASQWDAVRRIIDTELGPYLGWSTDAEAAKAGKAANSEQKQAEAELAALAGQDLKAVGRIIESLKLAEVAPDELPQVGDAIADIAEVLGGIDEGRRNAIRKIIKQLPKEGEKALKELAALMDELTVGQITRSPRRSSAASVSSSYSRSDVSTTGLTRSKARVPSTVFSNRRCGSWTSTTG